MASFPCMKRSDSFTIYFLHLVKDLFIQRSYMLLSILLLWYIIEHERDDILDKLYLQRLTPIPPLETMLDLHLPTTFGHQSLTQNLAGLQEVLIAEPGGHE